MNPAVLRAAGEPELGRDGVAAEYAAIPIELLARKLATAGSRSPPTSTSGSAGAVIVANGPVTV